MSETSENENGPAVEGRANGVVLAGFQRKYLRGVAHELKPLIHVGRAGVTPALVDSVSDALDAHELIKVKFLAFKDTKRDLIAEIVAAVGASEVGLTGHIAILFRENADPDRRKIRVPQRGSEPSDLGSENEAPS